MVLCDIGFSAMHGGLCYDQLIRGAKLYYDDVMIFVDYRTMRINYYIVTKCSYYKLIDLEVL